MLVTVEVVDIVPRPSHFFFLVGYAARRSFMKAVSLLTRVLQVPLLSGGRQRIVSVRQPSQVLRRASDLATPSTRLRVDGQEGRETDSS